MYNILRYSKQTILLFILFFSLSLYANNLRVENITLTGQNTTDDYTMVQFDISWDNSWRDIINSDAVWVFVKYKGSDGLWQHARLGLNDPDHTAEIIRMALESGNGTKARKRIVENFSLDKRREKLKGVIEELLE